MSEQKNYQTLFEPAVSGTSVGELLNLQDQTIKEAKEVIQALLDAFDASEWESPELREARMEAEEWMRK